jgi:hypothetical protein
MLFRSYDERTDFRTFFSHKINSCSVTSKVLCQMRLTTYFLNIFLTNVYSNYLPASIKRSSSVYVLCNGGVGNLEIHLGVRIYHNKDL